MITVKAFKKDKRGLYTDPTGKNKFYFEIGKTYIHNGNVEICESGFHASRNCDTSETVAYYPVGYHYGLVDVDVVDEEDDKVVGDRITLLKELTFEECIEYDKTGRWCYQFAKDVKGANVELLQDAVIAKDKTGEWCYGFAKYVNGANVELLQDIVIARDITGNLCYWFSRFINEANVELLQDAVIAKDKTGEWCYYFADNIKGANIELLQDAVIAKDEDGYWCYYFARDVNGANMPWQKKGTI